MGLVAAGLSALALTTACSSSPSAAPPTEPTAPASSSAVPVHLTQHFRSQGLAFRYPREWTAKDFRVVSSFTSSIVYLSDQPMHHPCRSRHSARGITVSCGWPPRHLQPGRVLMAWSSAQFPGGKPPRTSQKLDGHPATIQRSNREECQQLGAAREVRVTVWLADGRTIVGIACLAAPSQSGAAQVDALIKTVRLSNL